MDGGRFHGGFYVPGVGVSLGLGLGLGLLLGYGPGWYGGYYGAPYGYGYAAYGYVTYATGRGRSARPRTFRDEAQVFLDGRYIGTADDFDGFPDFLSI